MGRNVGRIGGVVAGIIAIVFGILDLADKVQTWILFTLGAVAIIGVLAEYLWKHRGGDGDAARSVKQKQEGGRKSTNNQAGRDININQPLREGNSEAGTRRRQRLDQQPSRS